jgi:hypothetical protein
MAGSNSGPSSSACALAAPPAACAGRLVPGAPIRSGRAAGPSQQTRHMPCLRPDASSTGEPVDRRAPTSTPRGVLAAATGIRRSELLGLRWIDANLAAAPSPSARPFWARRRLPAGRGSQEHALRAHDPHRPSHGQHARRTPRRAGRAPAGTRRGVGGPRPGLPRQDGTWWNPPAISLAFIRAVKRAGVPRIRLHGLSTGPWRSRSTLARTSCPACSPRPRTCSWSWSSDPT